MSGVWDPSLLHSGVQGWPQGPLVNVNPEFLLLGSQQSEQG